MAKRGRKAQSNETKRAKGESRPSRQSATVVEFPVIEGQVPEAPDWLGPLGVELWDRVVPLLYKQKALTEADLPALETMCAYHDAVQKQLRAGLQPTASEVAQLRLFYSEFGLTNTSRVRLGKGDDGNQDNPFTKNGRKPTDPEA